jgi:hypothetical protein
MNKENLFDEIRGISTWKLVSDMPDAFTATVQAVSKIQGTYGTSLKLELQTDDNISINVSYRIPRVLTGKGQLDQLLTSLKQLDVPLDEIEGKTFEWQRQELAGTMKGNPRHYPIRLVTKGKAN